VRWPANLRAVHPFKGAACALSRALSPAARCVLRGFRREHPAGPWRNGSPARS
jgi:hypothetical protein